MAEKIHAEAAIAASPSSPVLPPPKVAATAEIPEKNARIIPAKSFRNVALGIIAAAALIWLLKFAEDVIIPVLLGLIISYSLRPLVDWLKRVLFIPRPLAAALLIISIFGGVGAGFWNLRADAAAVASELPKAARMIREFVGASQDGSPGVMGDIRRAASEIDQASAALNPAEKAPETTVSRKGRAATAGSASAATRPVAAPEPYTSSTITKVQAYLLERVGSLFSVVSTLGVAGLLAFFLLCAGTEYRKKLLQIVGQSLARKKITLTILNEINTQVQYYLAATAATNIGLGLATWALFAYFGIERAFLWGIVATVLHLIPYLGTGVFLGLCFLIGLVSLDGFWPAFYLTAIWLMIQFAIGFGLATYIQSRSARINSAALFVGFLLFGWLWGGWGLLVAAPVLAAVKAVTSRVKALRDISTLMS